VDELHKKAKVIREFAEKNFSGNMSAMARAMGMRATDFYKYHRETNPLPAGATMRERLASVGLNLYTLETNDTDVKLPRVTLIEIPVYESVHAGTKGQIIMQDALEHIAIAKSGDKTLFGVKVKGDSMSPRINQGDTIVVSEAAEVRNNDLAIVSWKDGEFNLRYITYSGDNVILSSENSTKYPPAIVAKNKIHRLLRVVMRIEKF
jgi:SOS-response transcriptional repressor LexA